MFENTTEVFRISIFIDRIKIVVTSQMFPMLNKEVISYNADISQGSCFYIKKFFLHFWKSDQKLL